MSCKAVPDVALVSGGVGLVGVDIFGVFGEIVKDDLP